MTSAAREVALKWLAKRMRTTNEVRTHLNKKGFSPDDIDAAIVYLNDQGFLDDANYAELFIRDKCRFSPCGRYKLYEGLRLKGIAKGQIQSALQEHFPPEIEKEMAEQLVRKQQKRGRSRIQVMRYLQSKGFSADAIQVTRHIPFDEDSDSLDNFD